MSPNITQQLRLTLEYVDPFQVRVTFSTLGEIERLRFERRCKNTYINPDNFDIYIEERQCGKSKGETDRYFSIKTDRCLRDIIFRGERHQFTPSYKRLRSVPDVLKLYRPTDQDIDDCIDDLLEEFREPLVPKAPKAPKAPKTMDLCKSREMTEVIEYKMSNCHHPNWTFSIRDKGGHQRTLCCEPSNKNKKAYGVCGVTQRPDCTCPLHRNDTYWRRLSSYALTDRTTKIRGDTHYLKMVVGLISVEDYHRNLEDNFRRTFGGLINSSYMEKSYLELEREGMVIDEIYPRCEGKDLKTHYEIAYFLAKVFHHKNTQLLIRDNNHARKLRVDTNRYKMLINGSKGGAVEDAAKEDFKLIVPSDSAISYMLDLVNTFSEKEPKLEL